jgi:predicted P-loop ATPase
MHPGCKADTVLVLEGNQGVRKSTALRTLAGDDWYLEIVGGIDAKSTAEQFRRKWLVEIGELSAMRRTDLETFKGFVSRTADNYRPPYAKRARDFRRQCLMAGTTNSHAYLHDETGGRRFWPVRITKDVDIPSLARDRAQLLAEAVVRLDEGASWHISDPSLLSSAKAEQDSRYQEDPWHDRISEWLYNPISQRTHKGVTTADILSDWHVCRLDTDAIDNLARAD